MQLSRGRLLLVAGLAIIYAVFLAWYHCPYAVGSDSAGYLNSAKLLLEGKLTTPVRAPDGLTAEVLPRVFLFPLGFRLDATQQNLLPTYPIGLPLHYAAAALIIGLEPAVTLVAVVTALAFAFLLYATAREFGVERGWSASVTLLAAISPLTLLFSIRVMSDVLATTWALALILCALRSSRHAGWAAGAGAALAMAVLVRPSNALLLLPAALALQPRLRTWIAFGLGGLPGALFLAAYNHAVYGSYLASGYGEVSDSFAASHLLPTLWHFVLWVPMVATPFIFAATALPWLKIERQKKLVLVAWAGSLFIFYALYEFTQEVWWYLRFILPALPALLIAAALGLQRINYPSWFLASRLLPPGATAEQLARGRVARVPVAVILFVMATGWMLAWDRSLKITQTELEERSYLHVGRWVAGQMPARAIVAGYGTSGTILYYSDRPFINPSNLHPDDYARFSAWLDREHRPLYAALYPHEETEILQRMPGQWEVVTKLRQATIWRRVAPGESPASLP